MNAWQVDRRDTGGITKSTPHEWTVLMPRISAVKCGPRLCCIQIKGIPPHALPQGSLRGRTRKAGPNNVGERTRMVTQEWIVLHRSISTPHVSPYLTFVHQGFIF